MRAEEFAGIAEQYGIAQALACERGDCTHTHRTDLDPAGVDLRCPDSMGKLLGRAVAGIDPQGLIELPCNNCTRAYRRAGLPCSRVLHRYNLLGELLSTNVIA